MGLSEAFPLEITAEEAEIGFAVEDLPTGDQAAVARLPNGLEVIKIRERGATLYAVCSNYTPIYAPSKSLEDLCRRFRIRAAC